MLATGSVLSAYTHTRVPNMGTLTRAAINPPIDNCNPDNVYEEAVSREAVQDIWRKYYRARAIYDMKCSNMPNPIRAPIPQSEELEEFLQTLAETFQASQATYLDDLRC